MKKRGILSWVLEFAGRKKRASIKTLYPADERLSAGRSHRPCFWKERVSGRLRLALFIFP